MFENSVQEYYLQKVKRVYNKRKKRLSSIKTTKQALAYINNVRKKIAKSFNLPKVQCPLNPQIIKEQVINNITIKNVIYYSRRDFPVTGLLALPEGEGKHPAVIVLCGHAEEGKANSAYQTVALNLAQQGFVSLIIDPIGQGERHQFDTVLGCTTEHNFLGKPMFLNGEYFGSWRVWDAVRGIDFLKTLPEVDKEKIAITGNSGGGTLTTFVNALLPDLAMAAPSCYITTWLHEVENELPADIEQMPPRALEFELDMADFIIAQAPRPTLILGQKNDFFDPRGTLEAYEDAKHIYKLLGAEDNIQVFIGPDSHGYHLANREAMYTFFNRHAFNRNGKTLEDNALQILDRADTYCSKDGEIFKDPQYRKVFNFSAEKAKYLTLSRKIIDKEKLRKKLAKILGIGKIEVPYFRTLRPGRRLGDKYETFSRFGLETEQDRVMAVLKLYHEFGYNYIPEADEATLYISHLDSDIEIYNSGGFKRKEYLFGLDVRGIGEVRPSGCDNYSKKFFGQYLFDYHFASLGVMFNKPILGGKVRDILSALELLKAHGVKKITLKAEGQGTIPALIAAFLSDIPDFVELNNMPESWEAMAKKDKTLWPLSAMAYGIIGVIDFNELRKYIKNLKYSVAEEPQED